MEIIKSGIFDQLLQEKTSHLLSACLKAAISSKLPIAFYRLPESSTIVGVITYKDPLPLSPEMKMEDQGEGFVIAPFLNETTTPVFIKADCIIDFTNKKVHCSQSHPEEELFFKKVKQLIDSGELALEKTNVTASDVTGNYKEITGEAILQIHEGTFKKVVIARNKTISINLANPSSLFLELCESQINSFVSLFSIPGKAVWVGASPEILISITKDRIFKTVALAGTQRAADNTTPSKAVWTQKEIEEQALVSRYIINCFKTIRLREYEEDGPKTVVAGNLIHLKTEFNVHMDQVNFPDLGSIMLRLLHPTSAVCGMPKEQALEFIKKYEKIDRKYYSGFLGPINIENESHIFVNIRCAEIAGEQATLYSGAGITSESDPEKEYEETVLKMQLLENLFAKLSTNKN